jgi:N6-L-threonylcarbamoyladenine synthase
MLQYEKSKIRNILSIDTSCDDTSVAIVSGTKVLSNIVSSQIELHKEWGGVVPGLARREHENRIDGCVEQALKSAGFLAESENDSEKVSKKAMENIDAIAVTYGPGLAIALEVGVSKAKELALKFGKPIIPVNHMEGHLLSSFAMSADEQMQESNFEKIFPSLGILVSGGHTELVYVKGIGDYKIIGQTLDDAIGESFDKVAKILNLGYPGGPIVSKLALNGDPLRFELPVAMKNDPSLNISYSGLKTAVLYLVRDLKGESRVQERKKSESWSEENLKNDSSVATESKSLDDQTIADICASFQKAAIETLLVKIRKALRIYDVKSIICGGGVINNFTLREKLKELASSENKQIFIPQANDLFMDNAAMIGVAAYLGLRSSSGKILASQDEISKLDRDPSIRL